MLSGLTAPRSLRRSRQQRQSAIAHGRYPGRCCILTSYLTLSSAVL